MLIFKNLLRGNEDASNFFKIFFNFLQIHISNRDTFEVDSFLVRESSDKGLLKVGFTIKTSRRKGYDTGEVEDILKKIHHDHIELGEDIKSLLHPTCYKESYEEDDY